VKKGNRQLLGTVDEAIRKLDAANPGWEVDLQSRSFFSKYSAKLTVTLSESQYINDLAAKGKKLKVLFDPTRYPLCYVENGKASGVLVEIFKQMAAEYHLPYEFIKAGNIDEYYKLKENGKADIVLDFSDTADEAEILGYRLTSTYASSSYSVITASGFTGTAQTAAVISGSRVFEDIAKKYNPRVKIFHFDTFGECVTRSSPARTAHIHIHRRRRYSPFMTTGTGSRQNS
jgi:hypothetical protein